MILRPKGLYPTLGGVSGIATGTGVPGASGGAAGAGVSAGAGAGAGVSTGAGAGAGVSAGAGAGVSAGADPGPGCVWGVCHPGPYSCHWLPDAGAEDSAVGAVSDSTGTAPSEGIKVVPSSGTTAGTASEGKGRGTGAGTGAGAGAAIGPPP